MNYVVVINPGHDGRNIDVLGPMPEDEAGRVAVTCRNNGENATVRPVMPAWDDES